MRSIINLTGKRFGRLTVIKHIGSGSGGHARWLCECDCGKQRYVYGYNLRNGTTKSCGCLNREHIVRSTTTHGKSNSSIYNIWKGMINRCYRKTAQHYDNYGGRGISVCDEWRASFQNFDRWAMNNGYCEGLSIDRIDNDSNYCPENCRWVSRNEQANNKRTTRMVTYNGETHAIAEWAEILGIKRETLYDRIIRKQWDIERAFTEKVKTSDKGE